MKLQQFEVPGLAHYSYLLGSNGQAVVIDPKRDIDTYLQYGEENGLKITHVLETHIHADYASGATALARATGAELWLSGLDEAEEFEYQFAHREFHDGNYLEAGDLRIVAVHTPGHTPEHLSFLVYEKSRCGQPLAIFTGTSFSSAHSDDRTFWGMTPRNDWRTCCTKVSAPGWNTCRTESSCTQGMEPGHFAAPG